MNCFHYRKRFAILVDNVFPTKSKPNYSQENVDKLLFYVVSSPEKLDRISLRLYSKMLYYLRGRKIEMVIIAADVMNQLLNTSRSSFLNLIITNYLKMLLRMLEDDEPRLRVHASISFRKFSKIDAETPTFYEYMSKFVSQFVGLCSSVHEDYSIMCKLHQSGLVGIQGLILKSMNAVPSSNSIWCSEYLSTIIPALVGNLKEINIKKGLNEVSSVPMCEEIRPYFSEQSDTKNPNSLVIASTDPYSCNYMVLALFNIHELLRLSNISSASLVLTPLLQYWTKGLLWRHMDSSTRIMQLISRSLPPQLEHILIQLYFSILNDKNTVIENKIHMIVPLPQAFIERSNSTMGPIYIEVLTRLIKCLKDSSHYTTPETETKSFQDSLIKMIETFFIKLPNFQKSETIYIILSKILNTSKALTIFTPKKNEEFLLKIPTIYESLSPDDLNEFIILIKCLEMISMNFQIGKISAILNLTFIEQLASLMFLPSKYAKLTILKILTNICDYKNNKNNIIKSFETNEFLLSNYNLDCDYNIGEIDTSKLLLILNGAILLVKNLEESDLEMYKEISIFVCVCCLCVNNDTFYEKILELFLNIQNELFFDAQTQEFKFSVPFQAVFLSAALCISMNRELMNFTELCQTIKTSRQLIHPFYGLPSYLLGGDINVSELSVDVLKDSKNSFFTSSHVFRSFTENGDIPIKMIPQFVKTNSIEMRSKTDEISANDSSSDEASLKIMTIDSPQQIKKLREEIEGPIHKTSSVIKKLDGGTMDSLEEITSKISQNMNMESKEHKNSLIAGRMSFYKENEYYS